MTARRPASDRSRAVASALARLRRHAWRAGMALAAAGTLASSPRPLRAQAPTPAERQRLAATLPLVEGRERVRLLARLVDAEKLDAPDSALAHGRAALALAREFPDDTAHVATLNEMAWAYMTLGRYPEAVASAREARRAADRAGLRLAAARSASNLGSIAQRRGEPEEAEARFREALAIQRTLGDGRDVQRDVANSLNNLGFVYSTDLADYDQALEHHLQALRTREALGDSTAIALSLNNIGIVYHRLRQYEHAREYLTHALAMRRRLGGRLRIAATLDNLGDLSLTTGDHAGALASHRESLAIRESLADRSAIAMAHRNLGRVHLAMGHPVAARRELLAALRASAGTTDRGLAVRNYLTLAGIERGVGRHGEAARLARQALAIADSMRSRELSREAWREVATTAEAAGRYRDALDARRRFEALGDSIYDETTGGRIARLGRRYAEERREREIERLRKEEALAQLQVSRRTEQRDAAAAGALLIVAIGAGAFWRRRDSMRMARELSLTDALTGARNRRYVEQTIEADLAASRNAHRAAAAEGRRAADADVVAFLVDLDHFKAVNDQHGHATGDRLLTGVARALQGAVGRADVVARWGGEEFLVLARFTDRAQAPALAERLRATVGAHALPLAGGRTLRVGCSVGFAAFPLLRARPEASQWAAVVHLADLALYEAKRAGRDAWVGYLADDDASDALGEPAAQERLHELTAPELATLVAAGDLRRLDASNVESAASRAA